MRDEYLAGLPPKNLANVKKVYKARETEGKK